MRWRQPVLFFCLLVWLGMPTAGLALTFTEDFTSTAYKDETQTSAL